MSANLPVLTSARIVTTCCLEDGELPHVVRLINDFLDDFSADCTIVDAYRRSSSLRFMQYVAAREDPPTLAVQCCYRDGGQSRRQNVAPVAHGQLPAGRVPDEGVAAAATNGHLLLLQWLFETRRDRGYWGNTEMCGALMNDHVEVVEWLRTHAVPRRECRTEVIDAAAGAGYLDIVKWLHDEYKVSVRSALSNAMSNRQWETSRWILENGELLMPWINWDQPAEDGALAFLKFLHGHLIGSPGYFTLQAAAWNGQLEVVKWLHDELGATLSPDAMRKAAQNGHLAVVEWFHANGCDGCDEGTLTTAADNGHLGVVKWLYEHGVQANGTPAIDCAARSGHLDVVKLLHVHLTDRCFGVILDDAPTADLTSSSTCTKT